MCITQITKRNTVIGWTVTVDGHTLQVMLSDLPSPSYPTIHQVIHTAKRMLQGLPADVVAFSMAIDAAFELALLEWERSETIRKECVRLTGIDHKQASKIENSYLDHSRVVGFDDAAKSAAYEIPDLGWNPDDDNGAALWEIVSRKPLPKPKRTDSAIRDAAISALQPRQLTESIPF